MAAVWKNLPLEFLYKQSCTVANKMAAAVRAKPELGKRNRYKEAGFAGNSAARVAREERLGPPETLHETLVESAIGAVEYHGGLRQECDHAAGGNPWLPRCDL